MRMNTYAARESKLKELGYSTYSEYLASPLWASIRRSAFTLHGRICSICGEAAAVIHHIHYGWSTLLGWNLKCLVPVCQGCHWQIEFTPDGEKRALGYSIGAYFKLKKLAATRQKSCPEPLACFPQRGYTSRAGQGAALQRGGRGQAAERYPMQPTLESLQGHFKMWNWQGQVFRLHPASASLAGEGEVVIQVWMTAQRCWGDFVREPIERVLPYYGGPAADPEEQAMVTTRSKKAGKTKVEPQAQDNSQDNGAVGAATASTAGHISPKDTAAVLKAASVYEQNGLMDLWDSSKEANHDFGFVDETPNVPKRARKRVVGLLAEKGLIELAEPSVTESGTLQQFKFTELGQTCFRDFDNSRELWGPDDIKNMESNVPTKTKNKPVEELAKGKGKPGKGTKQAPPPPAEEPAKGKAKGKPTAAPAKPHESNGNGNGNGERVKRSLSAGTAKRQKILQFLVEAKATNEANAILRKDLMEGAEVGGAVVQAMAGQGHINLVKQEDGVYTYITKAGVAALTK
jgi:hypothetical protein